jgi:hypothetical protein
MDNVVSKSQIVYPCWQDPILDIWIML